MSVTDPARTRAPKLPWPGLLVLAAGVFLSVTTEMLPTGLLPEMSEGLGVAEPYVGLLVSVFAFTVVVTAAPLTALTSRMPRRGLLVAVMIALGLSTLASAVVPEYWMLIAVRLVGGVAHGLFWALVAAYTSRLVPPRLIGRAVSVVLGGGTLALIAGVPLSTVLGQLMGWRPLFAVVGGLTLVGALLVRRMLPAIAGRSDASARGLRAGDPALVPVLVVCAITAATMLGQYAVFTYVAPIITDVVGLETGAVGPLLFVYGVTGAVGLVVAGSPLARHSTAAIVVAMVFAAMALIALGSPIGTVPSLIAFGVWGLAFGAIPPLLQTRLLRAAPSEHRDAASALYTTAFNVGIGGGALVGAVVFGTLGVDALPFLYAALLAVIALALVGGMLRSAAQPTLVTPATGPVRSSDV